VEHKTFSNMVAILFGIIGGVANSAASLGQTLLMALLCGAAGYVGKQVVVGFVKLIYWLFKIKQDETFHKGDTE
jgi:hypothetical protein